jgi:hypothetical protein
VRVAFNAALVLKAKLAEVSYVALELDEPRKRLRFVPCSSIYAGQPATVAVIKKAIVVPSRADRVLLRAAVPG